MNCIIAQRERLLRRTGRSDARQPTAHLGYDEMCSTRMRSVLRWVVPTALWVVRYRHHWAASQSSSVFPHSVEHLNARCSIGAAFTLCACELLCRRELGTDGGGARKIRAGFLSFTRVTEIKFLLQPCMPSNFAAGAECFTYFARPACSWAVLHTG
jgi:hypothetical protein